MTCSFDPELPTARDRVRSLIGDTSATCNIPDESIDTYLAADTEAVATAKVARALANLFALQPSSVNIPGGPSISWSDRVRALMDLAKRIEDEAGGIDGALPLKSERRTRSFESPTTEYRRPLDYLPEGYW